MQEQVQKGRESGSRADDAVETPPVKARGEQIKSELDDILDEIDEVLEENAEEFVRNYVQKGGQ